VVGLVAKVAHVGCSELEKLRVFSLVALKEIFLFLGVLSNIKHSI